MSTSKKFFVLCIGFSVFIIASNLVYKNWYLKRVTSNVATPFINYDQSHYIPKTDNLSTDMTSCQLPISQVEISYIANVVLAKKFSPKFQDRNSWLKAAKMQSRFLFGYFNLDHRPAQTRFFLDSKDIKFEFISSKNVNYPIDLKIRNFWNEGANDPYLRNAFENPFVGKTEAADSIQFKATAYARVCGSVKEKTLKLIFPKDPYLAYWAIADSYFTKINSVLPDSFLNPCAHQQMTEIRQSAWFWYTWAPSSKECLKAISNSPFYDRVQSTIKTSNTQRKVANDFFPNQDHYDVSLIFGTLMNQSIGETMKFLKENLTESTLTELYGKYQKINSAKRLSETTLMALSFFLKEIPHLMSIENVKVDWLDQQSVQIVIFAKLNNGKSLKLKLFYGITSIDYIRSDSFLKFAIDSLALSDFIFYTGHAGGGSNFSLPFWAKKANLNLNQLQQMATHKKFQGFVLVSCYSNSYFGEDLSNARSDRDLSTLLVRSASQDYIFYTSLGLINFLRQNNLNDRSFKSFIEPFDLREKIMIDFY